MFFIVERIRKSTMATAAMPECNAPMTKYGPKTVEDQPGRVAMAKSQDTMVCTENMTGMIAKAKMFMAVCRFFHSPSVPRKPRAQHTVEDLGPARGAVAHHGQVRDERQE